MDRSDDGLIASSFPQSFMDAYNILKHDLLNDELLDKPPAFSQEWFSEASAPREEMAAAEM